MRQENCMPARLKTDYTRWRLKDDDSRHTWHYLPDEFDEKDWPQSHAEKYELGLPMGLPALPKPFTLLESAFNTLTFFEKLQLPSGHWGCEVGGPSIFCAGIVIALFVTETTISPATKIELRNHVISLAHKADGGWGLHTTSDSNLCGTVINYCVLRILGIDAGDPVAVKARKFIRKHGGATHSSIWAKIWMSVLGVTDWDIVNPLPLEMWLLPEWLPFAPWRMYCEARMVFQSMGYLWSKRIHYKGSPEFLKQLQHEVLVEPYDQINWKECRSKLAPMDNIQPRTLTLRCATWVYSNIYQPFIQPTWIKEWGESHVRQLIDMEDRNTGYAGIAATDAPMNTIICYFEDGPESATFKRHAERLHEYMWMTPNGMQMNSTNGNQTWDIAFLIQAVCECGFQTDERWEPMLLKAYKYLEQQQIREDCIDQEKCYRQPRKGGWAFSNKDQGWVVSDCAAEGLKAVIMVDKTTQFPKLFSDRRIFDAVDTILIYQNRGVEWIKTDQWSDGSWYGSWGICFTYATMFALDALACIGETYDNSEASRRGCEFLLSKQREDGGWSESFDSCESKKYSEHPDGSLVDQTSWAVLGLVHAQYPDPVPVQKGVAFLMSRQQDDGRFPIEAISGSFHSYSTYSYPNYKFNFTMKAMGLAAKRYGDFKVPQNS